MRDASILIVEDEAIIAEDIKERLAGMGYGIAGVVTSGEAAVDAVHRTSPDLVLMDILLRGSTDGIDAATVVQDEHDTPVVFVTASGDPMTLERLRSSGGSGYVRKPFDDRTLEINIELALFRHAAVREQARAIAALEDALARVRTLEGLLPICCVCKNIRNDDGSWQRVESYIAAHSGAQFTHGYCPVCAAEARKAIGR